MHKALISRKLKIKFPLLSSFRQVVINLLHSWLVSLFSQFCCRLRGTKWKFCAICARRSTLLMDDTAPLQLHDLFRKGNSGDSQWRLIVLPKISGDDSNSRTTTYYPERFFWKPELWWKCTVIYRDFSSPTLVNESPSVLFWEFALLAVIYRAQFSQLKVEPLNSLLPFFRLRLLSSSSAHLYFSLLYNPIASLIKA